jgi:hypothetical protein
VFSGNSAVPAGPVEKYRFDDFEVLPRQPSADRRSPPVMAA